MDAVLCRASGLSSSTCAASTVRVRKGACVTVGGGGDTGDDDSGPEWRSTVRSRATTAGSEDAGQQVYWMARGHCGDDVG